MTKKANRILFVLSLVGVIVATYVLQSFLRNSPILCVNSGCELVRKSPLSKLFGIPVPAFGLIGYTFIGILSFAYTTKQTTFIPLVILLTTMFGVIFVTWFTYTELFSIKAICTWCVISAINMYAIFLISLQSIPLFKQK